MKKQIAGCMNTKKNVSKEVLLINSGIKKKAEEDDENEGGGTGGLNFFNFDQLVLEEEKLSSKVKIKQNDEGSNQDAIKNLKTQNAEENRVGYSSMFHHDYIKPNIFEEPEVIDEISSPKVVLTTAGGQQVVKTVNSKYTKAKNTGGKGF